MGLRCVLVARVELGKRDLLLALGFGLADILRVAGEAFAAVAVHLVVGLDPFLLRLVGGLVHLVGGECRRNAQAQGQNECCDRFRFHDKLLSSGACMNRSNGYA
jgi:hypothetical protein